MSKFSTAFKKVLIVEDSYANLFIASAMFKKWGFSVYTATNGVEAVDCITSDKFDLVLMDISMPIMSGIEATKIIRRFNNEMSLVPIVALTAHVSKEDHSLIYASGMNDIITKPYTAIHLQEVINRWV